MKFNPSLPIQGKGQSGENNLDLYLAALGEILIFYSRVHTLSQKIHLCALAFALAYLSADWHFFSTVNFKTPS
jgi:hypothetical protein